MNRGKRRRPDPIFMGVPSPAISKINKMNMQELTQRIETLKVEAARIAEKIKNISNIQPRDDARIASLQSQQERLIALAKVAEDRLAGKEVRSAEYDARRQAGGGGYNRGPGAGDRPYGGGRGYSRPH